MTAAIILMVMLSVVITHHIGVISKASGNQRFCCCISAAGNTTVKPDTRIAECPLGTAANTAADQSIHLQGAQNSCQCTMAAAARIHNLRRNDISIFHIIDF